MTNFFLFSLFFFCEKVLPEKLKNWLLLLVFTEVCKKKSSVGRKRKQPATTREQTLLILFERAILFREPFRIFKLSLRWYLETKYRRNKFYSLTSNAIALARFVARTALIAKIAISYCGKFRERKRERGKERERVLQ